VSSVVGGRLPTLQGGSSAGFVNDLVGGVANGAVNASARRLFGLGKQDWCSIAADAFGNALGNAAVARLSAPTIRSRAQITRTEIDPVALLEVQDLNQTLELRSLELEPTEQSISRRMSRATTVSNDVVDNDWTTRGPSSPRPSTAAPAGQEWYWGNVSNAWGLRQIDGPITDLPTQYVSGDKQFERNLQWSSDWYFSRGNGMRLPDTIRNQAQLDTFNQQQGKIYHSYLGRQQQDRYWRDHPMAQMSAIPEKPLYQKLYENSPWGMTHKMLAAGVGDALVSIGFGEKIEGQYGNPDYVVNPVTGDWMNPLEVQNAKLMTFTSFMPAGRAEAAIASEVKIAQRTFMDAAEKAAPMLERVQVEFAERAAGYGNVASKVDSFVPLRRSQISSTEGLPAYWDEYYSVVGREAEDIGSLSSAARDRGIKVVESNYSGYINNTIKTAPDIKRWEFIEEFLHYKVDKSGSFADVRGPLKKELKLERISQPARVAEEIVVKQWILSKPKFFKLDQPTQVLLQKQIEQLRKYGVSNGY
jgi:hypothetical protein